MRITDSHRQNMHRPKHLDHICYNLFYTGKACLPPTNKMGEGSQSRLMAHFIHLWPSAVTDFLGTDDGQHFIHVTVQIIQVQRQDFGKTFSVSCQMFPTDISFISVRQVVKPDLTKKAEPNTMTFTGLIKSLLCS